MYSELNSKWYTSILYVYIFLTYLTINVTYCIYGKYAIYVMQMCILDWNNNILSKCLIVSDNIWGYSGLWMSRDNIIPPNLPPPPGLFSTTHRTPNLTLHICIHRLAKYINITSYSTNIEINKVQYTGYSLFTYDFKVFCFKNTINLLIS